jgi:UDP-galactopyranose mutase
MGMIATVVGAGLTGATIARLLAEKGWRVTVHEARDHVAGNAYDEQVRGSWIHRYGPHLFHTNNFEVVKFLSRFTDWVPYEHKVVAAVGQAGKDGYTTVPFPPNDATRKWLADNGKDAIEVFYRPYTEKMWGRKLEDVAPQILERVPSREGGEDRYFPQHDWQMLPRLGYTAMVKRMLDHEKIDVLLKSEWKPEGRVSYTYAAASQEYVFYSGGIDRFYGTQRLAYRTIEFLTLWKKEYHFWQVMNFTDQDTPFTRVTNWSEFPNSVFPKDYVDGEAVYPYTYEIPGESKRYETDFYPVRDTDSMTLYDALKKKAAVEYRNAHFVGRCGSYAYIDMDQAVNQAMQVVKKVPGV